MLLLQEGLIVDLLLLLLGEASRLLAHGVAIGFFVGLLDDTELLLAHLEENILALLDLSIDPLDLELVGMDLSLIVLELSHHLLELLSALLQISLILGQLLGHIRTTLLRKNVLKLNVKLLFLLDEDVFLRDFLSLGNQTFLETLNLLDELISLNLG